MNVSGGSKTTVRIGFNLSDDKIGKVAENWLPDSRQLEAAINNAVNKTARWAKTLAAREIRAVTGLPAGKLKDRLKMFKLGFVRRIYFGLNPIPVSSLSPKRTKTGVKAKGGINIPGAFIVDNGSGQSGVYKRRGKDAYSIDFLRVHFDEEALRIIRADIEPDLEKVFLKNLEHELKWQMSK